MTTATRPAAPLPITAASIIQSAQAVCGWALYHLPIENHRVTGKRLTPLTWVIGPDDPQLSGLALTEATVREWADHLNCPVDTSSDGQEVLVETRGEAHGAAVRVWTRRPVDPPTTTEA